MSDDAMDQLNEAERALLLEAGFERPLNGDVQIKSSTFDLDGRFSSEQLRALADAQDMMESRLTHENERAHAKVGIPIEYHREECNAQWNSFHASMFKGCERVPDPEFVVEKSHEPTD